MLFIKNLLNELYPHRVDIQEISILCLITSNQTYLIFNKNEDIPEFVIHIVTNENIRDLFIKYQELYDLLGNTIARPLHLIQKKKQYYFIESGLKGTPWFELSQKVKKNSSWKKIKHQAIDTLYTLHTAIKKSSFGEHDINPGKSLMEQYQQCVSMNIELPENIEEVVKKFVNKLDQLGTVNSFFQHGDYCLNNLLFDDDITHIIDFEDIMMTTAPLHDEFSLALSFFSLIETSQQQQQLAAEIKFCLTNSYWKDAFDNETIQALFLHHLLLRLGRWSHNKKRKKFKEWLLLLLNDYFGHTIHSNTNLMDR